MADHQFGLRPFLNTAQLATHLVTKTIVEFDCENVTVVTLFDVVKAFDHVWIDGLIYKLNILIFPLHLTQLIHSYLTGRQFRVCVIDAPFSPFSLVCRRAAA